MVMDTETLKHMMNLRRRILRCILVFLVFFVVFYFFKEYLLNFMVKPLEQAGVGQVLALGVTELFFTYIRVAGWAAFLLVLPLVFLEGWLFIRPGLFVDERQKVGRVLFAVVPLFYGGMALAYMGILPFTLAFFLGFEQDGVQAMPALSDYLDFMLLMLLACGLVLNLPLFLVLLVKLKMLSLEAIVGARRWVLVGILLVAAVLTPPDPLSLFILAGPVYGLFELTILLMRWKWL